MEIILDEIAMILVILILFAIFIFSLIGTLWMFEQTEIGKMLLEWLKERKEE